MTESVINFNPAGQMQTIVNFNQGKQKKYGNQVAITYEFSVATVVSDLFLPQDGDCTSLTDARNKIWYYFIDAGWIDIPPIDKSTAEE